MKQQFYSDKDMTEITYTTDDGVEFSVCNKIGSRNFIVECTSLDVFFSVDNPDTGVKIMKSMLGEHDVI